jgi:histidinol-phosphate phosphatase family protein
MLAPRASRPAVFLDKDGTLVENLPFNVDPARMRLAMHAIESLRALQAAGFALVLVTNQPGLAWRLFTYEQFGLLLAALDDRLRAAGVTLADYCYCPHAPDHMPGCRCRKPAPGMLERAARIHALDLARSWMLGDILDDVEAGHRAGCRSILVDVGNETQWRISALRLPEFRCQSLLDAAHHVIACSVCAPREA